MRAQRTVGTRHLLSPLKRRQLTDLFVKGRQDLSPAPVKLQIRATPTSAGTNETRLLFKGQKATEPLETLFVDDCYFLETKILFTGETNHAASPNRYEVQITIARQPEVKKRQVLSSRRPTYNTPAAIPVPRLPAPRETICDFPMR